MAQVRSRPLCPEVDLLISGRFRTRQLATGSTKQRRGERVAYPIRKCPSRPRL